MLSSAAILPHSHHNFFRLVSMKAAQNFFEGRTRFVTDSAQKTSLTKLVLKRSVLLSSQECRIDCGLEVAL